VQEARRGAAARSPGGTTFLGFELGARIADLQGVHRGLEAAPADVALARTVAGVPSRITLRFRSGRLWMVMVDAPGEAATVASYEALQVEIRRALGAGHATRCDSERGVSIEEDLASGEGSLRTDWPGPDVRAELALSGDGPGVPLRLTGFAALADLDPDCEPSLDMICGESRAPAPPAPGLAAPASDRSVPLLASPPAGTCAAAAGASPAELLGVRFGASRAVVEAALGVAVQEDRPDGISLATVLAGVPGRLHLRFYDDCLAVVLFRAEGAAATAASYEALRAWARPIFGEGRASRCVSVDAPAALELGSTRWPDAAPLGGSLRFEAGSFMGLSTPPQIVLEVEHPALRPFAPRIDFAGP